MSPTLSHIFASSSSFGEVLSAFSVYSLLPPSPQKIPVKLVPRDTEGRTFDPLVSDFISVIEDAPVLTSVCYFKIPTNELFYWLTLVPSFSLAGLVRSRSGGRGLLRAAKKLGKTGKPLCCRDTMEIRERFMSCYC